MATFQSLHSAFRGSLRRYFARRVQDDSEAEDLVQEVFERLVKRGEPVEGEHVGGYIFETANSVFTDRLRRRRSRRADVHEEFDERGFQAATQSLRYTVADPLLEQIGRAILAEMQTETAAGSLLVESLCSSLTARLLQSHSTSPLHIATQLSSVGKLDPRRLSRVLEYIHAHLGDVLDIRGMATTANLSRFHFARAFKAATGQTPYQYVSTKRLERAKAMLAQNQPLAQIALALNFSSQANFTRAFRQEFGITPGRYREQKSR